MSKLISEHRYLCILLVGMLTAYNAIAQLDSAATSRFGLGYKEMHYGIPFLYLEGTDYQMGLEYGHLLKNELTTVYTEFENLKKEMMDREIKHLPWYEKLPANLFGGLIFKHKINEFADRLPVDIEEQIRGVSEGSELPESFFREIQVMADLNSIRCEGIVIVKGEHTYHCHNLDQPLPLNLVAKYPTVVSYNSTGKQRYTNLGFAACLMLTSAFNENGISLTENANNNPAPFDKTGADLYIEKNRIITQTHNLAEVDSVIRALRFSSPFLLTVASSREEQAVVYDLLGSTKASTRVSRTQFIANRTLSPLLGKKSESIYSAAFHDTARELKVTELLDTTKPNIIDAAIAMLSNTDFYHYTDSVSTYIESLHNFETDQSVIFDLYDSTIYFSCNPHFGAWNRWLQYNYITRNVKLYKEADPRLISSGLETMTRIFTEYETCDWRDSSNVRALVNTVTASGIQNYFTLNFLSGTYLNYFHSPAQAESYAELAIDQYPDIITGYIEKGEALEAEKNLEGAITEYTLALNTNIRCEYFLAEAYERLALVHCSLGRKDLAAECANKALAIHNQYWIPEYLNERIHKLESIKDKSE